MLLTALGVPEDMSSQRYVLALKIQAFSYSLLSP